MISENPSNRETAGARQGQLQLLQSPDEKKPGAAHAVMMLGVLKPS